MKNILFALLLISTSVVAQEKAAATPSFKRMYVGISTTQGVGYRLLSRNPKVGAADGLENVRDYIISSRNEQEKPGYAANAGIRIGVNVTKFFAVETGIEYARRAYSWKMENLIFGYQWDGTQYVPGNNTTAKFNSSYHYIDIPLSFNFSIGKKKVRTAINTGTYFDLLVNRSTRSKYSETSFNLSGSTSNETHRFTKFNVSPFLGIGIDYQINNLMSLRVMPIAQFQVLQNIEGAPISERLYSGGIHVALNFGFVDTGAKHFKYTSFIGTKKNGKPKE